MKRITIARVRAAYARTGLRPSHDVGARGGAAGPLAAMVAEALGAAPPLGAAVIHAAQGLGYDRDYLAGYIRGYYALPDESAKTARAALGWLDGRLGRAHIGHWAGEGASPPTPAISAGRRPPHMRPSGSRRVPPS